MSDEEKIPSEEPAAAGDAGQGAGDVVRNVFGRIGEALDTTAKVARLSLDIGALNSRRGALFQEMGAKVYDLYGKGLVKNAALLTSCADVASIDAQIAEKRAQIAEMRGQHRAGTAAEPEDEFGIEEEPGAPPTSSGDLSTDEEREIRPPGERKL